MQFKNMNKYIVSSLLILYILISCIWNSLKPGDINQINVLRDKNLQKQVKKNCGLRPNTLNPQGQYYQYVAFENVNVTRNNQTSILLTIHELN